MDFVNNWIRPITLEGGAVSASLDLPDGNYFLTIADSQSAPTRWEIVDALVEAGTANIIRGQQGTQDQSWPSGSVIYCSVTAQQLTTLFSQIELLSKRLDDLEGGVVVKASIETRSSMGGDSYVSYYVDPSQVQAPDGTPISGISFSAEPGRSAFSFYFDGELPVGLIKSLSVQDIGTLVVAAENQSYGGIYFDNVDGSGWASGGEKTVKFIFA